MVVNEKSIRRKSAVPGQADDDDWVTQDLADDAVWKRIQQNTFTRWANEHLKTVNKYIACLEADMSDGIRLLALVEVLSGKKLPRYNARPTMKAQKLNNVDTALRFLTDVEKVKLVNISSGDIVEGNLKLILGLMWTLILHYSISMPVWEGEDDFDPSLTPKQRLLKWIQNKIPDVPVNNFTKDWNDGKAIGALVDSLAPGLCPDWKNWQPEDNVKNVTEALQLAEDWLDVPQLIRAKEMCNRKVDELSMMTYLSQFPGAKLKENAPLRSSAGNPARVRCYGPGLQATGVCVGAPTNFTVETFSAGKGDVSVTIVNPENAMVPVEIKYNDDKNMTYTCIYTPTMEGDHKITVMFNQTEVPKSPFNVTVKGAPLGDGYKKVQAKGPGIEPKGKVKVGQQTYIDIITQGAGAGQVEVVILDPQGKPNTCPCRLQKVDEDKYKCEYVAGNPGGHSVSILFAGKPIPKSPFNVSVDPTLDPRKVKATGRGLQATGMRVGDKAQFQVCIDDVKAPGGASPQLDPSELNVKLIGPDGGEEKVNVKQSADGKLVFDCDYTPTKEGDHRLSISMGGENIRQFEINVAPPSTSKVVAFGPGLHGGTVASPNKFTVDTRGERGTLGFTIDGPGEAKIECKDNGDGTADVEWTVSTPGEYALHILSNGEDIPNSPYCAQIKPKSEFDEKKYDEWYRSTHSSEFQQWTESRSSSSKKTKKTTKETTTTTATTSGEEKVRKMVAGLPSTMTIKMADPTGLSAYILAPSGAKTVCDLKPHEDGSGRLSVNFVANEPGEHLVYLVKNDKPIGGSPFKIQVSAKSAGDPAKVKVDGDNLKTGKINETNVFYIDTRSAGTGGRLGVSMYGPCKPEIECNPTDESGLFKVTWTVEEAGKYNLELKYDGAEIPGSPFTVVVPK
uniref:Filamin-C n=1 Tax=Aceria tosichella TaxID=561515 RepID=A0A6G1S6P4_9ACAR